jgi:hypothetical protein
MPLTDMKKEGSEGVGLHFDIDCSSAASSGFHGRVSVLESGVSRHMIRLGIQGPGSRVHITPDEALDIARALMLVATDIKEKTDAD